jgi:two-component system sensor histidine kinase AlgZ
MHPIFEKKTWLAGYLTAWMVLGVMLAGLIHIPGNVSWRDAIVIAEPLMLFYAFVCLTPWYMCRQLPLGSTNGFKLVANHLGAAILADAIWVQMARAIARLLDLGERPSSSSDVAVLAVIGLMLYSLSVALYYMLLAVERSREAEVQARDAELRALKAQINPHFLFNSLNSISALTSIDPSRARDMCVLLGDFLRMTLGLGEKTVVRFSEELDLLEKYLAIEKVRFGDRLRMQEDIQEESKACMLPPLLLQPLVENAVKHGIASLPEGGHVRLSAERQNSRLAILVENSWDPDAPPRRSGGRGLKNVEQRLEARYGKDASLHVSAGGELFQVSLSLPAESEEKA